MQIKIIAFILFLFKAWTLSAQYHWQLLPQSPQNGQKQDDVFFLNPTLGWSVNGSGRIYKTVDGGANWVKVLDQPGTYFRCISFLDSLNGFAGNIGPNYFPNVSDATLLYRTADGGASWQPVYVYTQLVALCVCLGAHLSFVRTYGKGQSCQD